MDFDAVTTQALTYRPSRLSVAPMMEWTDRHCRYFHRLLSKHTELYTEMVTAPALVRGGAMHLLEFDASEHPVTLQLGGSDPHEMAQAAKIGAQHGYDAINVNVGCPSDRVQSGAFGAVLMETPQLVQDICKAMQDAVDIPVTVKCRIGVDAQTPEEILPNFLDHLDRIGMSHVIIHARMAWLDGLSPKENRTIPPLNYALVHQMKAQFPHINIAINGGIETLEAAGEQLEHVDGVMIGRTAYHRPYDILAAADGTLFDDPRQIDIANVIAIMASYTDAHVSSGGRAHSVARHMLGLFTGQAGARHWRQYLSTHGSDRAVNGDLLRRAYDGVVAAQTTIRAS